MVLQHRHSSNSNNIAPVLQHSSNTNNIAPVLQHSYAPNFIL